jgi:hypothetical protein
MTLIQPARMLRLALVIDAAASGALGLLQTFAATPLARVLGLHASLVLGTGVFLLAYAATLVAMARCAMLPSALLRLVVVGNLGWAAACIVLAVVGAGVASLGVAYLWAQAVAVIVFAAFQGVGLGRSPRAGSLAMQRA